MKISIVVPFYENINHLKCLLKSLDAATHKSQFQFELLVVNDSPWVIINKDELKTLFKNDILIVVNDKNMGVAYSRNKALELLNGQYIHLIDQDDLIHENFYCELEVNIENNLFCVYNVLYRYKNSIEHKAYYIAPSISNKSIIKKNIIRSPGQVVFSRSLLNCNTMFPNTYHKGADDRFFWINIVIENREINFRYIEKPYYIANIHDNNYSHDFDNLNKSCIENWFIIRKNKKFKFIFNLNMDVFLHLYFLRKKIRFKNYFYLILAFINYYLNLNKIIVYMIKRIKM